MKHIVCLLVLLTFTIVARAQDAATTGQPAATQPTTKPAYIEDASYGVGFSIGNQIKQSPIQMNMDQIQAGIQDALAGKKPRVEEAAFRAAMQQFQTEAMAAAQAKQKEQGEKNTKDGDAYRAENGKKAGVKTTDTGLQIETVKEGTGEAPKATDNVKVHYTGTLIDGTKFDSSVDRGQPAEFNLGGVIKGWTEGLQQMKVGGKSRLVVPPTIGYGPTGNGPIPPNATLIFDIELLEIVKQAQPEQAPAVAPAPEAAPAPAP